METDEGFWEGIRICAENTDEANSFRHIEVDISKS